MLIKLKNIWNSKHPDIKINKKPTKNLGKVIRINENTCDKESCWLKHKCLEEGVDKSI